MKQKTASKFKPVLP